MAGYSSAGQCFATVEEAIDNYYSQPYSMIYNINNGQVFRPVKSNGVWFLEKKLFTSTGETSLITGALNTNIYGSCPTPNDSSSAFITGTELGWAVSSVIVIAFVLRRLRRGF
jgi:hypothetical protein